MDSLLVRLASRFWPDIKGQSVQERSIWLSDAYGLIYSAPLCLAGLAWLLSVGRLPTRLNDWGVLLFALLLIYTFRRLQFFSFVEIKTGLYADWGSSLEAIPTWAAVLLVGPIALWPGTLLHVLSFIQHWSQYSATKMRLNHIRRLALELADETLLALIALALYRRWGGMIPIPGLQSTFFFPALYATFTWYVLSRLVWLPYFILAFILPARAQPADDRSWTLRMVFRLYAMTELVPACIAPFAVLTAGLFEQNGLGIYFFAMVGLVMIALLANLLSQSAERSYHRSREMERLEALGTEIIDAPLDASTLPELLQEHVPGMFPDSQVEIRIFPDRILLSNSPDWPPIPETAWVWMQQQASPKSGYTLRGSAPPWQELPAPSSFLTAPIFSIETGELIGGICMMVRWWPPKIIPYFMPALQSLASQLSSTLHQAEIYMQTIAHERVVQELELAGEIQMSLLPQAIPHLHGFQISAGLEPTRETSGDFYDWIPLEDGKLGILIADVADKGMGAALYMTLSRTLIRSYAVGNASQPEMVLKNVNARLLADAAADLFVTVFYAVLDPATGTLDYCNAGQNPPFQIHCGVVNILERTGMALGVLENAAWKQATTTLQPGDVLVFYTDGIIDAQNVEGDFYEQKRLIDAARDCSGKTALEIKAAILDSVHAFAGDTAIFDDMTLLVLTRDPEQ
jgi:serine phosphatase RsbU (regulator of sigma subunit)